MYPYIFMAIASICFTTYSALAWTGPTATAPSANTSAPLNVGSLDQVKNASIGVNGLAVFGNTILSGISGNAYLNFGTTAGSTGYGIRDNAGTLEFKNNGGSWTSLGGMQAWTTNGTTISNTNTGNVGIGTTTPPQKLTVVGTIRANVLQAHSGSGGYAALNQGNTSQSGYLSWFKPDGVTRMAYLGWWPTDLVLNLENGSDFGILNGNVGIGTTTPGQRLTVTGMIQTTAGGIMFPDGTVQDTAAEISQGARGNQIVSIRTSAVAGSSYAMLFRFISNLGQFGSKPLQVSLDGGATWNNLVGVWLGPFSTLWFSSDGSTTQWNVINHSNNGSYGAGTINRPINGTVLFRLSGGTSDDFFNVKRAS